MAFGNFLDQGLKSLASSLNGTTMQFDPIQHQIDQKFKAVLHKIYDSCKLGSFVNAARLPSGKQHEIANQLWREMEKHSNEGNFIEALRFLLLYKGFVTELKLYQSNSVLTESTKECLTKLQTIEDKKSTFLSQIKKEITNEVSSKRTSQQQEQNQHPSNGYPKYNFQTYQQNNDMVNYRNLNPSYAYNQIPSNNFFHFGNPSHINNFGNQTFQRNRRLSSDSKYSLSSLESLGQFKIKHIDGDGNCAFRAIAQGIYLSKLEADGKDGGNVDSGSESSSTLAKRTVEVEKRGLSKRDEKKEANILRKLVCEKLLEHREMEVDGTGLTVEQMILLKDPSFTDFENYVLNMKQRTYAGEMEFWILAKELSIIIEIYIPNEESEEESSEKIDEVLKIASYGTETPDARRIKLLWTQGRSEAMNHYDLLLSKS